MGSMRRSTGRHRRAPWRWPALALIGVLAAAGCSGQGASKAGGAPEAAPDGTITLSFASADQLPVDTTFATLVAKDSGGHLKLHTSYYNGRSTSIDVQLAAALQAGKLDVGDVASRAWESLGIEAFRAYQVPFLVTSRSLLDRAVTRPVAAGLLAALKPAKADRAGHRADRHQVPAVDAPADGPGAVLRREDPGQRLDDQQRGDLRAGRHPGDQHCQRARGGAGTA